MSTHLRKVQVLLHLCISVVYDKLNRHKAGLCLQGVKWRVVPGIKVDFVSEFLCKFVKIFEKLTHSIAFLGVEMTFKLLLKSDSSFLDRYFVIIY